MILFELGDNSRIVLDRLSFAAFTDSNIATGNNGLRGGRRPVMIKKLPRSFMTGIGRWNLAAMLVVILIALYVLPSRYPLLNLTLIFIAVFHAPVLFIIHFVKLRRRGK
jgi:hypothetical protein